MKFKNGSSAPAPDGEALSRDYEQAQDLGEARLGQLGLYLPRLTHGSRAGIDGLFLRILWQERFPAVSYLSFWWRADFCLYSLNNYFQKVLDILAKVVIMQITICAALAVR